MAKADELELYERLLAEKRYETSESENKQEVELRAKAQHCLETIGRMIDK